jgi:hypothetical protein
MSDQENDNIFFFFDESVSDNENNNDLQDEELSKILKELDNIDLEQNDNLIPSLIFYYEINYNIKQLLLICEYYKIAKDLRINKSNKMDIINTLVLFENNEENMEIVLKRKQLWFYINELKNDKFMKKYVLWN